MTLFEATKLLHVSCAFLSIGGFFLRGFWMVLDNALLQHRLSKVVPHIVDTLLLGSAIAMLVMWQVSPMEVNWLLAKIIALLVYIGLGMVALRFGRTRGAKVTAWLAALLTAAYIVSVAYAKSPWGFLGY